MTSSRYQAPSATTPATTTPATPPTAADPGTGVAKRDRVELPPELRARIAERQIESRMVAEIKGATWSGDLSADAQRAVATWAAEHDVEPVTEIDILGGNVYVKAEHYRRKMGELASLGLVKGWTRDWVQHDPRLDALAAKGDEAAVNEIRRRQWARIQHGIEEGSDYACVFSITYKGLTEPAIGVKTHVPGKKKTIKKRDGGSFQVDADPVGDQFPMETIETRAIRRAMLSLRHAFPPGFKIAGRDADEIPMAEIVEASIVRSREDRRVDQAIGQKPLAALNAGNPADPYAVADEKRDPAFLTPPAGEPWDEDEIRRQDIATLAADERAERERQARAVDAAKGGA